MPLAVNEILAHADELATRFEQYEPRPEDELDMDAITFPRAAVAEQAAAERHASDAVWTARHVGMSRP